MKFTRFLAMLLAMMLMGTMCMTAFAEAEEEYPLHETILLSGMEMTTDEWLADGARGLFAVLFQLELGVYEEEYPVSALLDQYGIPTIYLAVDDSDPEFTFLNAFYFFGGVEGGVLVCGLYLPDYGMFNGFVQDYDSDPASIMPILQEGGSFTSYYEVTFDEYYEALLAVDSIINGAE